MKFFLSITIVLTCLVSGNVWAGDFPWPMFNATRINPYNDLSTQNRRIGSSLSAGDLPRGSLNWNGSPYGPQCETSLERTFSVSQALDAIGELEALINSSLCPLIYPELGVAEELMRRAGAQLEQVMNYGIWTYIDYCATCDPRNYVAAALRLIIASHKVYGKRDYDQYNGLVESVIRWFEGSDPKKYCGQYWNAITPPSWLVGEWEFGRTDVYNTICDKTSLSSATGSYGRKMNNCNEAEAYYWLLGSKLIFLDSSGTITYVLEKYNPSLSFTETYFFGEPTPRAGYEVYFNRQVTDPGDLTCENPPSTSSGVSGQYYFIWGGLYFKPTRPTCFSAAAVQSFIDAGDYVELAEGWGTCIVSCPAGFDRMTYQEVEICLKCPQGTSFSSNTNCCN